MVQRLIPKRFGEEVEEYLNLKSNATRRVYGSGFELFREFYQSKYDKRKGFSDYLDRIFAELQKPRREQKRVAETELVDFINYLKELGKSNNTIRAYFGAIQNFLKYKGIVVSASFVGNLPPATEKPINHKHEWTIEQIEIFINSAQTFRDKTIIACLFQSGLGVNELTQLNYGDIQDEFEKGILPICLKLVRKKTNVKFKTFFGRDSVKYLRLYLATRKNLTSETPLFTKWSSEKRITPAAIQQKFSEIAKHLPFIKREQLRGFNPVRPHSLRAAFESQLIGKVSDKLIQFFMGHSIGTTGLAYLNKPTEELRKDYMNAERYLTIEKTSQDEGLKVSAEVERRIKNLEETINDLQRLMENKIEQITYKVQKEWLEKNIADIQQEIRDADIARWKEQTKQTEKEREETKQTKENSTKTIKTDKSKEEKKPTYSTHAERFGWKK